jgi:hypothetical protein
LPWKRAAALPAPQAIQVAGRWHLLLNARQLTERWLAGAQGRLRRLTPAPPVTLGHGIDATAPVLLLRREHAFHQTRGAAEARRVTGEVARATTRCAGATRPTNRSWRSAA